MSSCPSCSPDSPTPTALKIIPCAWTSHVILRATVDPKRRDCDAHQLVGNLATHIRALVVLCPNGQEQDLAAPSCLTRLAGINKRAEPLPRSLEAATRSERVGPRQVRPIAEADGNRTRPPSRLGAPVLKTGGDTSPHSPPLQMLVKPVTPPDQTGANTRQGGPPGRSGSPRSGHERDRRAQRGAQGQ